MKDILKVMIENLVEDKEAVSVDEVIQNSETKYECTICKYVYNPKYGNERAGVHANTSFDNLPENWVCPVCGEKKDVFEIYQDK